MRADVPGAATLTLALAAALGAGACSGLPYAACPVGLDRALPTDAFARSKRVLMARYGALAVVDPDAFLLQTDWTAVDDPPGERRASVFRDGEDLAVLVEARSLVEPVFGLPYWGSIRGDHAAERQLAEHLRAALSP